MAVGVEERRARRNARRSARNGEVDVEEVEAEVPVVEVAAVEPVKQERRQRRVVAAAPEPVVEEDSDEGDDDEVEVEPTPVPAPRKAVKAVAVEPKVEEPEFVAEERGGISLDALLLAIQEGESIMLTRTGYDTYAIHNGKAENASDSQGKDVSGKQGRLPSDFWKSIQTDEYNAWIATWSKLTYEQKVDHALKNKIEWEAHDNERVDHMRVTLAVQTSKHIEKYKPAYREPSAFKQAKALASAGKPY